MKKIIALLIAIICLSSISVAAVTTTEISETELSPNSVIVIDDGFYGLYYDGEYFTGFDLGEADFSDFEELNCRLSLTDAQTDIIRSANFSINAQRNIIMADYGFKNGSTLSVNYIKNDFLNEYNSLMGDSWVNGEVDFYWPDGNIISVSKNKLMGQSTTLLIDGYIDYFDVNAVTDDGGLKIIKGQLIVKDDEYYYLDFNSAGVDADNFDLFDYQHIYAYRITDEELCGQIEDALDSYYGSDLGFLNDDKFTQTVADILLVAVFIAAPLLIALTFIILAIFNKTGYKKFFRAIYISSLLALAVAVALIIIL